MPHYCGAKERTTFENEDIQYSHLGNLDDCANAVRDWPKVFWKAFPEPLQELIRSYLKGMIDSNVFENALTILLSE